jgi:DNA-binding transcriptional ArsR family regulator
MTMPDPTSEPTSGDEFLLRFFKALGDPLRLGIAGWLAQGPATLGELALALGVSPRGLPRALAPLVDLGLVRLVQEDGEATRGLYQLDEAWLRERSAALLDSPRSRALAGATDDRARVLATFIRDGKLTSIPTGDKRKLIILDELARRFEPNRTYTEREVNAIIKELYERDYTSLRRMLVDYYFLNRDRSVYWRGEGRREWRES